MASSATESVTQLSRSEAKCALTEVIRAINESKNRQKMTSRLGSDRSDPLGDGMQPIAQMEAIKHMQFVFPIATQILMEVIANYGFSKSGEGVVQFTLAVRHMQRFDDDIRRLYTQMRTCFLPTVPTTSANKSSFV